MKRALLFGALLLAACGKPEDDSDLKAAFAASALKDPSSVQLRNVQANTDVICGEYNSKNSYGAYSGFEPFVFQRSIKDLWLGDSDNTYSHSAFWKDCPNAAQLGLAADDTDMNATDMNATDMNATDMGADAAGNAADTTVENAGRAVEDAQEQINASEAGPMDNDELYVDENGNPLNNVNSTGSPDDD